ncbi:hypothetical protein EUTSA_v10027295mg, partial [Eutrema salsugineum]
MLLQWSKLFDKTVEECDQNHQHRLENNENLYKAFQHFDKDSSREHVIWQLLSWKDLHKLVWEGSILQTALKGYEIELSWSGDVLLRNGVPLIYPD